MMFGNSLSKQELPLDAMNYKRFTTRTEYGDEDGLLIGHITGIKDVVWFHGESVSEL